MSCAQSAALLCLLFSDLLSSFKFNPFSKLLQGESCEQCASSLEGGKTVVAVPGPPGKKGEPGPPGTGIPGKPVSEPLSCASVCYLILSLMVYFSY